MAMVNASVVPPTRGPAPVANGLSVASSRRPAMAVRLAAGELDELGKHPAPPLRRRFLLIDSRRDVHDRSLLYTAAKPCRYLTD
jgi:hypothetical protein